MFLSHKQINPQKKSFNTSTTEQIQYSFIGNGPIAFFTQSPLCGEDKNGWKSSVECLENCSCLKSRSTNLFQRTQIFIYVFKFNLETQGDVYTRQIDFWSHSRLDKYSFLLCLICSIFDIKHFLGAKKSFVCVFQEI